MSLKELRKSKKLTQAECAKYLGMPLRTYQCYETDKVKTDSVKYIYMKEKLAKYGFTDEANGVLTVDQIRQTCSKAFEGFDVSFCYLFGSYAKNTATEESDVDLLISASVSGLRFYDLAELLRESLHKKVDLLTTEQLHGNDALLHDILKEGIKIYG